MNTSFKFLNITLRLPGELIASEDNNLPQNEFVKQFTTAMREMQPTKVNHHNSKFKPYDGPFVVKKKYDKYYIDRESSKTASL